jgi:hypothetical protein
MRRHLGIGSINLRLVEAGLDDGDLGIVRHQQFGHAAERCEGSGMGADPVGQRLPIRREATATTARLEESQRMLAASNGDPLLF